MTSKDKKAVFLMAIAVAIVLAIFVIKASLDKRQRAGPDNCIGTPSRNTVILLDHSEGVSTQTRDEIIARTTLHMSTNVQFNERVSVFAISHGSKLNLEPLVSLCRPPEDGNRAYENVAKIRKNFKENFERPIRAALMIPVTGSTESPIAQAITDLSLSQYLRGRENTLIIFSDMLEHTEKFSIHLCKDPVGIVERYSKSMQGAKIRPTFVNTEVFLNLIPRTKVGADTVRCRDKFWPWFFGDNSGAQAKFVPDYLPG